MENLKDDDYVADALTGAAVDYIRTRRDQPFALMLSHYAVHTPVKAKPADIEIFRKLPTSDHYNPTYAAMVKSVDDSVGRVVDALRETGSRGTPLSSSLPTTEDLLRSPPTIRCWVAKALATRPVCACLGSSNGRPG